MNNFKNNGIIFFLMNCIEVSYNQFFFFFFFDNDVPFSKLTPMNKISASDNQVFSKTLKFPYIYTNKKVYF
jgi:hypothetical protein